MVEGRYPSELRRVREIQRKIKYFKKCEGWMDTIGILGVLGIVLSYSIHTDNMLGFQDIPSVIVLLILVLGIAVSAGSFYLGSRYSRLVDEYSRRVRNF